MKLSVFFIIAFLSLVQCKEIHMSCRKIRAFVDGHNLLRLRLAQGNVPGQPAASEMRVIVWDEELQQKSAEWISKYKGHKVHKLRNPNKTVPSGRFKTGENIFCYSTKDLKYKLRVDRTVKAWFNEHKNYTFGRTLDEMDHFVYGGPEIGNYTQACETEMHLAVSTIIYSFALVDVETWIFGPTPKSSSVIGYFYEIMVWSDSIYIGCAISRKLRYDWHYYFVVCYYGPQGNTEGQSPYKTESGSSDKLVCDYKECNRLYGKNCK